MTLEEKIRMLIVDLEGRLVNVANDNPWEGNDAWNGRAEELDLALERLRELVEH
jgi:hypothetical protein